MLTVVNGCPNAQNYKCFEIRNGSNLKGYVVLKIQSKFGLRIGFIMDILTVPNDTEYQDKLINLALRYFRFNKVDIVSSMLFNHSRFYKSHKSSGFFRLPNLLFPQEMYFAVKKHLNCPKSDDLFDSKNWHVTWGDSDVI